MHRPYNVTSLSDLAEGGYIERKEPIVLIGECGTGKTHLATGLCLAACRQKRRVRFTTAVALVNELVEAKQNNQVRKLMTRWQKYELIALNEVGYVPLADIGAEFLFQVISERAERAAIIVTTNLPFSEWTTVFPNPRLCKALLDRITDRAHIIETGTESFRFRRTLERSKNADWLARHQRGRGNDGLWKAWENDKAVFPPFPQPLEIAAAIPTFPPPRLRRA